MGWSIELPNEGLQSLHVLVYSLRNLVFDFRLIVRNRERCPFEARRVLASNRREVIEHEQRWGKQHEQFARQVELCGSKLQFLLPKRTKQVRVRLVVPAGS